MTSREQLTAARLMEHIHALADEIGPRPTGHPSEEEARDYVRQVLRSLGFSSLDIEELWFPTPDTWGYTFSVSAVLGLLGNLLSVSGRLGAFVGGAATLLAAYNIWTLMSCRRQPLAPLYSRRQSANLIVRLAPTGPCTQRLVLLGHLDTNKHRLSFAPRLKRAMRFTTTLHIGGIVLNGAAQLARTFGPNKTAAQLQFLSLSTLLSLVLNGMLDERSGYIDGASDNASAVACLLELAAVLRSQPLEHTEVWFAFTGAEEVGGLGLHALLDRYSETLRDAWFLDFEMVGVENIRYVTRHRSASYLSAYRPDRESLVLANETARRHPELAVTGQPVVITEEIGALRSRGFRGLCLVGVGPDGWLANWHQYDDNTNHINPSGPERAARFALAFARLLDAGDDPRD